MLSNQFESSSVHLYTAVLKNSWFLIFIFCGKDNLSNEALTFSCIHHQQVPGTFLSHLQVIFSPPPGGGLQLHPVITPKYRGAKKKGGGDRGRGQEVLVPPAGLSTLRLRRARAEGSAPVPQRSRNLRRTWELREYERPRDN